MAEYIVNALIILAAWTGFCLLIRMGLDSESKELK